MTYYNYKGVAMPESASPVNNVYGTSAGGETLRAPNGPAGVDSNGGKYDVLIGGSGDDTFWVKDYTDQVQVAAGLSGVKTIIAWNSVVLPANVQNLQVFGADNYAAGNNLDNLITTGNDANTMYGGPGNDVLVGGFGKNNYLVRAGEGNDVIYNFEKQDTVRMPGTAFKTFAQVTAAMTQVGADVVLKIDSTETLTFRNIKVSDFTATNFNLPLDPSQLGAVIFQDNFNTLNLYDFSKDTGTWRTNLGGSTKSVDTYSITGNDEKEVYTDANFQGVSDHPLGFNPFSINNGVLSITAQRFLPSDLEQYAFGRPYSSGMLTTNGVFQQKYGYFEMRAEVPTALGSWPAFWLVNNPYKPGVEADVLEHLAIYPNLDFVRGNDAGKVTGAGAYMPDPSGFHTYGMLWTATTTTFYLDNYAVMQMPTPASWTDPMYLIINLAVGGWGGPIDDAAYPAKFNIDYVKTYALADGSTTYSYGAPPAPSGTIKADKAPVTLANTAAWGDAHVMANGTLLVSSAIDSGYGSHKGVVHSFNAVSGAGAGADVNLYEYAGAGVDMIPLIAELPGGYWQVNYGGNNTTTDYEIYNSAGSGAFFHNQYNPNTTLFTPLSTGGRLFTSPPDNAFGVADAAGAITWHPFATVDGAQRAPSTVDALSNGGFFFSYAGSQQLSVYDASGSHLITTYLGAPVSDFAMATAHLPGGQFAVAWLSPITPGQFQMQLTFQTFDSNGVALASATTVARDDDPWHTQTKVFSTGAAGDALLLWSQGGAVFGSFAHGSTVGPATALLVGDLDHTTQTPLTDGRVVLTWMQQDSGVNDLWAEIIDPANMTWARQLLGPADGDVHVVPMSAGAFAVSWHHGAEIDARAYDGQGQYGLATAVAGDLYGVDASGDLVSVSTGADGLAHLQHYHVTIDPFG